MLGATVLGARVLRPDVLGHAKLTRAGTRADGSARTRGVTLAGDDLSRALLAGQNFTQLRRRGKVLLLVASNGDGLAVHLGMTGQLTITNTGPDTEFNTVPNAAPNAAPNTTKPAYSAHTHVVWSLVLGPAQHGARAELSFRDPRRFGGVLLTPRASEPEPACWQGLGPDALETPAPALAEHLMVRAGGSRRSLKAALLDQRLLAGVGNIYADEACFIARVPPGVLCTALRERHWLALATAISQVLARAVDAGGSTLRDYVNAQGQAGRFALEHTVYGRAGEPCVVCGRALASARIGGRMTVWCRACQRVRSP